MTRIDFKYTDKSEELNDLREQYPMLPIIPIVQFKEAHTNFVGNITKVQLGEVVTLGEDSKIYVRDYSGIDYLNDMRTLASRNNNLDDEEVKLMTDKRFLEKTYNELPWEKAIIIYIGDN